MVAIPNAPRMADMPKGTPLPEALYHLRLDKAEYKVSREKKTPMAECQLTVFGPDEAEEFHGRKVFENFMLSGEGMFKTRQLLEAAGKGDDFVLEDTEQLLGIEVAAVVQLEAERTNPDNPNEKYPARNKVQKYLPIT